MTNRQYVGLSAFSRSYPSNSPVSVESEMFTSASRDVLNPPNELNDADDGMELC